MSRDVPKRSRSRPIGVLSVSDMHEMLGIICGDLKRRNMESLHRSLYDFPDAFIVVILVSESRLLFVKNLGHV